MNAGRVLGDVALGMQQPVPLLAGPDAVAQLKRGDLDHAVSPGRVEAGGLGVEQDGTRHARNPLTRARIARWA